MAFKTDASWTPAMYRKAHAAWAANAPAHDGAILPREAKSATPRHGALSGKLRSLVAWKRATEPDDPLASPWLRYDLHADNDNFEADEPASLLLDTEYEIQPSINQLRREYEPQVRNRADVVYRRSVAVGGDVDFGTQRGVPEYAAPIDEPPARCRNRQIVTRIRGLQFSNGEQVVRAPVLKGRKVVVADVRQPAGALVRVNGRRPSERFRTAKGELPEVENTVGVGGRNAGALPCPDPVVDREWARDIRKLVDRETARVLDIGIEAANFREIGEAFGKRGKHAERVGKQMLIAACEKLDALLAANDNGWKRAA